jgi:hypothetical protein
VSVGLIVMSFIIFDIATAFSARKGRSVLRDGGTLSAGAGEEKAGSASVPAKLAASIASVGVSVSPEAGAHRRDLLELLNNNVLDNADKLHVVAVAELRYGHIDGALMMRLHHRYEVMVDITRGLHGHAIHHFRHGGVALFQERGFRSAGPSRGPGLKLEKPNRWRTPRL